MVAGDECAEKLPLTPGQIQRRHIQVASHALQQSYYSHESGRKGCQESFTANLNTNIVSQDPCPVTQDAAHVAGGLIAE